MNPIVLLSISLWIMIGSGVCLLTLKQRIKEDPDYMVNNYDLFLCVILGPISIIYGKNFI